MTTKTILKTDLTEDDGYKLLTALVVPRPIGWVGSRSADGTANLAPYSFFNAVSGTPPTVVFSPGRGKGVRRDTADNVLATEEFSLNVVNYELAEAMNATAAGFAADIDEFAQAGLTAVEGTVTNAPMVKESPAKMECRLIDHLLIGGDERGNILLVAEVVAFHIDQALLDGTKIDQVALDAIGRHAGSTYSRTNSLFQMQRPD